MNRYQIMKRKLGDMNKVPEITIAFWVAKIAATTLGETGGDALSMTLTLGYAVSSAVFFGLFIVTVTAQIRAKTFHPFLYWTVVLATTTAGTTMADFADRSLGIGYIGGSVTLLAALLIVLSLWRFVLGSVSAAHISSPQAETFYWMTILFSNTLGTALGDFLADDSGLGFGGGATVFGAALMVVSALHFWTIVSPTFLFWLAFILTRPLGATVGDLLTKPHADGGFGLSRIGASLVLAAFLIGCVQAMSRLNTNLRIAQRPAADPPSDFSFGGDIGDLPFIARGNTYLNINELHQCITGENEFIIMDTK